MRPFYLFTQSIFHYPSTTNMHTPTINHALLSFLLRSKNLSSFSGIMIHISSFRYNVSTTRIRFAETNPAKCSNYCHIRRWTCLTNSNPTLQASLPILCCHLTIAFFASGETSLLKTISPPSWKIRLIMRHKPEQLQSCINPL